MRSSKVALRFHALQLEELVRRGLLDQSYDKEVSACKNILPLVPYDMNIQLRPEHAKAIPSYRRPIYVHHQQRVTGGALNPRTDVREIETQYTKEGIVVVDNFLKPEVVQALHEFAALSQIYTDSKPRGYVGSYWDDGFMTPLLLQVIEELPAMFPNIFDDKPLTNAWAYNYDTQYQKGIKIHGDEAAVNCNLWVTPDDANLDKTSGGLIIYTKPVPLGWDFATYNTKEGDAGIHRLIQNANKVVVPYRQNRIVLFKSDLLHATDNMKFKTGFKNRRINLTFLYGNRGQGDDEMTIEQRARKSEKDAQKKSQV